jgi:hypothetical protein
LVGEFEDLSETEVGISSRIHESLNGLFTNLYAAECDLIFSVEIWRAAANLVASHAQIKQFLDALPYGLRVFDRDCSAKVRFGKKVDGKDFISARRRVGAGDVVSQSANSLSLPKVRKLLIPVEPKSTMTGPAVRRCRSYPHPAPLYTA